MDGGGPYARRPRPVADAPTVDASALTKAWLLALVAEAPLQQVATVPAAELARSGPALCGAVLAALGSDAELERLVAVGPEGATAPAAAVARLLGARTPAAVAAGVEGLRAVAWRALLAELRGPVPELVADLGDRLAYVCARVAEAALADRPADTARRSGPLAGALAAAASRGGAEPPLGGNGDAPPAAAPSVPVEAGVGNGGGPHAAPSSTPVPAGGGGNGGAPAAPAEVAPVVPVTAPPPPGVHPVGAPSAPAKGAPVVPATPPPPGVHPVQAAASAGAQDGGTGAPSIGPDAAASPTSPPIAAGPPPGVHVVELPGASDAADPLSTLADALAAAPPVVDDAPPPSPFSGGSDAVTVTRVRPVDTSWDDAVQSGPPWLASIERRLERRQEDRLPFAVLVAEVDDLDRLIAAQSGREVALALETAERGLTAELAPADLVIRERLGRWWLLSPDRDAPAARDLGERVAGAIGRAVLVGAPLSVSIGVAVCPDDGEAAEALAGRADEGMFAARAAGVPLAD